MSDLTPDALAIVKRLITEAHRELTERKPGLEGFAIERAEALLGQAIAALRRASE